MNYRRKQLLATSLALILVIAIAAAWRMRRTPQFTHLTLFVTGDSRGYMEPCGCRRDQAGGLSGRAAIIGSKPRADRLVVDVGNLTSGGRPYEILKLGYMMRGMAQIGYDAVNLGKTEAGLDREALNRMLAANLPFVSANVLSTQDGKPLTKPYLVIKRSGFNIGVTGVAAVSERDAGPGIEVTPPVEALAGVVAELKPKCDYLIVLAFVDSDTLRKIADQYPEVDCVLGGDVPQSSNSLVAVNRAVNFNVTDRGKVVGEIELNLRGGTYHADSARGVKVMGEKLKPDPGIQTLIASYKAELRDKRYELASAEGMERIQAQESTADEYVGAAACASCHADAHRTSLSTAHIHAFDTLVKKGSEYDPECLRCHTVGYGLYSGYVDAARTPHLENVQCESCHGRGKVHIAIMRSLPPGSKPRITGALRPVTPASCVRCHDVENSENFSYAKFWPKIKH